MEELELEYSLLKKLLAGVPANEDKFSLRYVARLEELILLMEAEKRPKDQRLVDIIHGRMCRYNHTDACGWGYGSWDEPCDTRKRYLEISRNALKVAPFEIVKSIMKII